MENSADKPEVYQTFPDGYVVRSMTTDDAKIVQKWYGEIGSLSQYDLDVALAVFPPGKGFYIGEYEGEVVASAVRLPWGPDIYYGSYYYVAKAHRGKGFGTRLRDEVAFSHVGTRKLCVDAHLGKVTKDNEGKYGYKMAFKTAMCTGTAREILNSTTNNIVMGSSVPFEKILEYDDGHFVTPGYAIRHKFLKRWCEVPGGAVYVAIDGTGQLRGYGVRRPCVEDRKHMVGPLYADDTNTAIAIMNKLSSDVIGETITISIYIPNDEALTMVKDCGFEMEYEFCRMHANGNPNEYKPTVYGLTSVDVCGF